MMEEVFSDNERRLLVMLVTNAHAGQLDQNALVEFNTLLSKLTGTDTVLVARRAYASRGVRLMDDQVRDRAEALYRDPRFADRLCEREGCGCIYRGPAVYCSLTCALLDVS
jgi:hypothetical protein